MIKDHKILMVLKIFNLLVNLQFKIYNLDLPIAIFLINFKKKD